MSRILYFDCFSGVAGDMTLGALIDLGLDPVALESALQTLPLPPWRLQVGSALKHGLRAVDVHVWVGDRHEGPHGVVHQAPPVVRPPHDAEEHRLVAAPGHDHGHPHDHHGHPHDHHGHPHHAHDHHAHEHHGHPHAHEHHGPHRHYADILAILEGGRLPPPVVARARQAFDLIAAAEAKVHGVPLEAVHFHEVGAVDSVVDLVGTAYGLWKLGIDHVESAPPPLGRGFVRCAHGRMPLPAPATLEILAGLPVVPCPVQKELVTPTGAAFLRAWARRIGDLPAMVIEGVGLGAGDLDLPDRPNVLRLILGREDRQAPDCVVVETNLDDLSPELAGHLLERLFAVGALDAWFVPIQMKKGRPGLMVAALCTVGGAAAVEQTLLAESSAIGLRRYPVARQVADRHLETVSTPFGPVPVKVAVRDGQVLNAAPEYEACRALAQAAGVPLKLVYQHAVAAFVLRHPHPVR